MNTSGPINKKTVLEALSSLVLPWQPKTHLIQTNLIEHLTIQESKIHLSLRVKEIPPTEMEPLRAQIEHLLQKLEGVSQVRVLLATEMDSSSDSTHTRRLIFPPRQTNSSPPRSPSQPHKETNPTETLQSIGCIIAIASGKGGVGKSSTVINLAVALARLGLRVGILDADVYGPSIPHMLGLKGQIEVVNHKLIPMIAWGVSAMSIGLLVGEEQAIIWRGPMVMGAIKQLLSDVLWGELDVLLVDTPPGTGDVQLTLSQSADLDGVIIVSTPQDIALLDARRAMTMFQKINVPLLGIIENMAYFTCPHCQERTDIFGNGGAKQEALSLGLPFLGEIPLIPKIRTCADEGTPVAAMNTNVEGNKSYYEIARTLVPVITRLKTQKTLKKDDSTSKKE